MCHDHGRLIQFDHKRVLIGGSRPAGEPISSGINTGVREDHAKIMRGLDHCQTVNGCTKEDCIERAISIFVQFYQEARSWVRSNRWCARKRC